MSKQGSRIPEKLKQDAIVEALFELRFETTTQPEFLLVRLADFGPWKNFTQSRLPAYSIPDAVRTVDPNLRYQPIFELAEPGGQRSVRIGPNALSYHLRSPYNGWSKFGSELASATTVLFERADEITVSRLGLRYFDALHSELHGISGVPDLDISVLIGGIEISSGLNVNVTKRLSSDTSCTVRVATPDFVTGSLPAGTTVMIDIDVFTPDPFRTRDYEEVMKWLENAHNTEKLEFFGLLTDETIKTLEDK